MRAWLDGSEKQKRWWRNSGAPLLLISVLGDMTGLRISIITYERLVYSVSNKVHEGLNISTGVFTAGYTGVWTVSFTIKSGQQSGEDNEVWLEVNNQALDWSLHYTYYRESEGYVAMLGSRTLQFTPVAPDWGHGPSEVHWHHNPLRHHTLLSVGTTGLE